ncbi:MAG: sulfotransferase family 2 domain-containing protein [Pseudomonadota bacterium]|jgi:hypothetical protein|nr:sulfotransferase family 2 domain-containing protein [Pseudomonadota bacterium]
MGSVFLYPPRRASRKTTLLAPFLRRYQCKRELDRLPDDLVHMAMHSVTFADGHAIYVKNSKAACTTITHQIYEWDHGRPYAGPAIHRDQSLSQGLWAYPDIVKCLGDPSCLKVTALRDPVARCVSGFTNFVLDQSNGNYGLHRPSLERMGLHKDLDDSVKFDLFLDYIAACIGADVKRMDEHFRPQFYNLRPDRIAYDVIGRVETLHDDLAAIATRLNLPPPPAPEKAARKNASQSRFIPTSVQVDRIKDLYAVDFAWLADLFPDAYSTKGEHVV